MLQHLSRFLPDAKLRVQRWLVQRGLIFFRVPRTASLPPTVPHYLKTLAGRGVAVESALSFDDEPQIQRELLGAFVADRVTFFSLSGSIATAPLFPDLTVPKLPVKPFLLEVDGETYPLPELLAKHPELGGASIILVRATLGHFWSGRGDLQSLARFLIERGFVFSDLLEHFKLHLLNAPQSRVVMVFEKANLRPATEVAAVDENARRGRISQALVFLSRPLATVGDLTRLAGRGSLGFAAGVLNPGAVAAGDDILLLARGEQTPWVVAQKNVAAFVTGCRPVLFELKDNLTRVQAHVGTVVDTPEGRGTRLEDFRLFHYRGELFSNHSRFTPLNLPADGSARPVSFESSRLGVAISRVDALAKTVTLLGFPKLDFPTGAAEKNWVMFEHQAALYLIYSVNPFHLLKADRWPELSFATVHREKLDLPDGGDGLKFRNSANPVEYDENYFLHMVHKVYPDKRYAFWGVLIEKHSLLPKKITARPMVCGWQSSPAAIIYACSLVVRAEDVLVFGGLNDTGLGFWKIRREKLDFEWIPLAQFV